MSTFRFVARCAEVLESFASKTRDKAAALTFMKKLMKRHGQRQFPCYFTVAKGRSRRDLPGYDFRPASIRLFEGPPMGASPPIELEDPAISLTMAVIMTSPAPLLLLDGALGCCQRKPSDAVSLNG